MKRTVTQLIGALALSTSLAACTNYSSTLTSPNGRVTTCSSSGFGLVSTIMAHSAYEDCVNAARANGYR